MKPDVLRRQSLRRARSLGFRCPGHLPLSSVGDARLRSLDEVVERAGALHAVIAVAFGFPPERALEWLAENGSSVCVAADERELLSLPRAAGSSLARRLELRIEGLWALCWALGHIEELDFGSYCGDNLADIMPDLKLAQSLNGFRRRSALRPPSEIVAMEDLAYCLDWAVTDARLKGLPEPGHVRGYVIHERRHALSWILWSGGWEETPIDT